MNDSALAITVDDAARRVVVAGDIEAESVPRLSGALDDALAGDGDAWVLDLSGVTFLPSLAVGAVVDQLKRASSRGQRLSVVSRPGSVARRVLQVMGIEVGDGPDA